MQRSSPCPGLCRSLFGWVTLDRRDSLRSFKGQLSASSKEAVIADCDIIGQQLTQSGHFDFANLRVQIMRELAILTFVSADGVMQAPVSEEEDRSGGFTRAGWAKDCWDNVMESVGRNAMAESYDVLLGRNTYDVFASHHSVGESPLNKLNKYVVTSRPLPKPWQPTIAIRKDVPNSIRRLKSEDGPLLQVHGSHGLIQLLLQHRLIDEYRIWTFPVVLGAGKRLFGDGSRPEKLSLLKSESLDSGAVMNIYRNAK